MSYRRSAERNRRLKQLYDKSWRHYPPGAWFDERKGRYVRCYRPPHSKRLKNQCNRRVRRAKAEDVQNGRYKKVSDFWWTLD